MSRASKPEQGAFLEASDVEELSAPSLEPIQPWVKQGRRVLPESFDGYQVLRKLGEGGMGEAYLVHHQALQTEGVVKVMHRSFSRDPVARDRFVREAQTLTKLRHPSIVGFLGFGTLEDEGGECFYLVMEYVEGKTLREISKDRFRDLAWVKELVEKLLDPLSYIHSQGVTHRDLKSTNILVTEREGALDEVKLIDFGLSIRVGDPRLTAGDKVLGSPLGLDPEALGGGAEPGPQVDLYALAAMLFSWLSGRHPYDIGQSGQGSNSQEHWGAVFKAKLQFDALPLSRCCGWPVARPLEDFLARALRRESSRRYPDLESWRQAFLRGIDAQARLESEPFLSPTRALPREQGDGVEASPEAQEASGAQEPRLLSFGEISDQALKLYDDGPLMPPPLPFVEAPPAPFEASGSKQAEPPAPEAQEPPQPVEPPLEEPPDEAEGQAREGSSSLFWLQGRWLWGGASALVCGLLLLGAWAGLWLAQESEEQLPLYLKRARSHCRVFAKMRKSYLQALPGIQARRLDARESLNAMQDHCDKVLQSQSKWHSQEVLRVRALLKRQFNGPASRAPQSPPAPGLSRPATPRPVRGAAADQGPSKRWSPTQIRRWYPGYRSRLKQAQKQFCYRRCSLCSRFEHLLALAGSDRYLQAERQLQQLLRALRSRCSPKQPAQFSP